MMKRETKRRIAYYQEALPDMKKKVTAAALMLMIAVIVSVTAAYAWMTLSVAPVVSSVNTTMSANGTLEIALSNPEGTEPEEMDIDESVTSSTDVAVSNLRWGNLVNLSDSSYGIDNLALRPAQLNSSSLDYNPLKGAVYGADGRVETLASNYAYVKWDPAGKEFIPPENDDKYGVRAIASYTLKTSGSTQNVQNELENKVINAQAAVDAAYKQVPKKMQDLSSMLSNFASSKLNDTEAAFKWSELKSAHDLYKSVYDTMVLQKDAFVALANLQSYVAHKNAGTQYVELTWKDLEDSKGTFNAASVDAIKAEGVSLVGLSSFISDFAVAEADVGYLKSYYEDARDNGTEYKWSSGGASGHQISNIVTNMIDYRTMTMKVGNDPEVKLINLSASSALSFLGKTPKVYVYNGIFQRFEQLAINESSRMRGESNGAKVTIKVSIASITGECYTKAVGTSYFDTNFEEAKETQLEAKDIVAEDTYGMAVDFWLRTNAEETYLTLEGAVVTDVNGEVYSYDGVNRVWGSTGNANLTTNSTTQGGGSCYIYYADTPEDMSRSLELLRSMKVAFVDKDGNLLAEAGMDTSEDSVYAVNGRVTVPLVLDENRSVPYVYVDETEAEATGYSVTRMTHDEPLWVTAIIYLDGSDLGNEQVLSADHIDGQLNIQFGSSVDLSTMGDKKLEMAERVVSASATPNKLDWNTDELSTNVTVTVDGTAPETVTALFVRAINSTQGERQFPEMVFSKKDADGREWTSSYNFNAPGVYYLRHVRLDGVDYTLENPVMIEVKGFSISDVRVAGAAVGEVYTPNSFYETEVTAKITNSDTTKRPQTVRARFLRDDGIMVNVDMRYDPSGVWKGTGTFSHSGTYKLQYMLLDGEYYDVSNDENVLTLYLGLNVKVEGEGGSMKPEEYEAGKEYFKKVYVTITDNDGKQLPVYQYDENGELVLDKDGNSIMLSWVTDPKPLLVYSSGSTNTVTTTLDWDAEEETFVGTLLITAPGRYTFRSLEVGNNSLTHATEAAIYTIMSPEPPEYVLSRSTSPQFAPLTNDGFIGPIKIKESSTVALVAELYNDVTKQTYYIPNEVAETYNADEAGIVGGGEPFMLTPGNGTMSYNQETESWFITPKYTTSSNTETQEGTWTVKNLYVWEFRGEDGTIRDVTQIEKWPSGEYDYSGLTTRISCSLKVEMVPSKTKLTTLGDANTAFMANHYVKDIGMQVLMTNNEGEPITGPILNKMTVTLPFAYSGNTGEDKIAAYGYEVSAGARTSGSIPFAYNSTKQCWEVRADYKENWQYVGEYVLDKGLSIHIADGSNEGKTVPAGMITGVPEMYTVISETPTTDNLTIGSFTQDKTTFGKDANGNVTGFFLDGYRGADLGKITVVLQYEDENKDPQTAEHAVIPISVELHLTHTGNNQAYGGYSWSGDNEAMTKAKLKMENDSGEYTVQKSTPLLAGTYTVKAVVTCGGETKEFSGKNISVYSKKPTVTMTAVSPTTEVTVSSTGSTKIQNAGPFTAYNDIMDDGKSAVVFASYVPFTTTDNIATGVSWAGREHTSTTYSAEYANYEMPSITFELSNAGSGCNDFTLPIHCEDCVGAKFSGNGRSKETQIGYVVEATDMRVEDAGGLAGEVEFFYKTETPHVVETQTIKSINAVYGDVTYTLTLSDNLSIVQKNEAPPSISFEAGVHLTPTNEKLEWTAPEGATSDNGLSFTFKLPTVEEYTTKTANVFVETNPTEWTVKSDWTAGTDYYAIYSNYVTGEPYQVSDDSYTILRKYYRYTYGCKNTYYYDVYLTHSRTWERTASVDTYLAVFGLTGWEVNGVRYEPGATITVNGANIKAIPILGELSRPNAPSSSAPRTQTGTTYIEKKLDAQTTVIGAEVTAQGSANRNQTTAISNATSAATSAAQNAAATQVSGITISGYTIVGSANALPNYTESAIVEGTWK